jgi:hypothetical protein
MELIDYINTLICLLLVACLTIAYLKNNRSIVNLLIVGFALRYFSLAAIAGPTIDILYTFALAIGVLELGGIISGRSKVDRSMLLLFCLPFVGFLIYLLVYYSQSNLYLGAVNPVAWFLKTSIFYIKGFLPYFLLGMAVKRQAPDINIEDTFRAILKVAKVSCYIAFAQFFIFIIFHNYQFVLQLAGLNGGYNYEYGAGGLYFVRVQGFFYEPKSLAAFLGMAIPVAFHLGKRRFVIMLLAVGVLTVSQTFIVMLLVSFFTFIVLKHVRRVRSSAVLAALLTIGFFLTVSSAKDFILENYTSEEETIAYKMVFERVLQRYAENDMEMDKELWGIPLQPDLELPAVNFFRDNPIFVLTGFGTGNYNLIPRKYFTAQWNINALEKGTFKGHFDMGWIYLVAELGALIFLVFFFCFTDIPRHDFLGKYYSFLWLVFFFHRIDFLLIAFFCLARYKRSDSENFDSNHLLQPGVLH